MLRNISDSFKYKSPGGREINKEDFPETYKNDRPKLWFQAEGYLGL